MTLPPELMNGHAEVAAISRDTYDAVMRALRRGDRADRQGAMDLLRQAAPRSWRFPDDK